MRRPVRGFTMVELIVVICVMGIMATLAMTRSPDRGALHEKGFSDQLVSMLRHARKLAISQQQRDVCVQLAAPWVRAVYANGVNGAGVCNLATPVAEPGNTSPFVLEVPSGVTLVGPTWVRFNPRGQPEPNSNQTINVGAQAFTISRETGIPF
jgi:MSHA pilin protein MshC